MTIFALPFASVMRRAWTAPTSSGAGPTVDPVYAIARIRELEESRDRWLHECEVLDEENERLRVQLRELTQ